MRKANISIFIPHLGCGKCCSFCNQNSISGTLRAPTVDEARDVIKSTIFSNENINCENTEIAFFGGSFTVINREYMLELLKMANEFISKNLVKGIRISTRPDCIDNDILDILEKYNVTSIELGCQSLDEEVLKVNKRGHTSLDAIKSANLIKSRGFSLGLQMMLGLYKDDFFKAINTANTFVSLNPDTVRIYPTIVLPDTLLNTLYQRGEYIPLTLEEAVNMASYILDIFYKNNINVIKLGLHSDPSLENTYLAGPYHPAFRELCESKLYQKRIDEKLKNMPKGSYTIYVYSKFISKIIGHKKSNINYFKGKGFDIEILPDISLSECNPFYIMEK